MRVPRCGNGSGRASDGSLLAAWCNTLQPMQLELGCPVACADEPFGRLADVVVDPTTRRVTHLVVKPERDHWLARLVPVELAHPGEDAGRAIVLSSTVEEVRRLPPVHEISFLQLDGFPIDDPEWDIGLQEVLALPYYPAYDVEPTPLDVVLTYDRIPKREVEIRRASSVQSADGHELGHVDGFVVEPDDQITHLVLERGHLWGRREVAIPIGAVATVETDSVTLNVTRDEVGALPEVPVQRWPPTFPPQRRS
jgi:sporulation protein YlmC with PRC-barrel domain